jgi:hypothetical protein
MIKIVLLDTVIDHDVWVFEGTAEEAEIHLRSKFMSDTKLIKAGALNEILAAVSKRFGVVLEVWQKVV